MDNENESRCIPKSQFNAGDFFHAYQTGYDDGVKYSGQEVKIIHYSLSDREYFAAMAMQGFTSNHAWTEAPAEWNDYQDRLVDAAVKIADALIKRLNEK